MMQNNQDEIKSDSNEDCTARRNGQANNKPAMNEINSKSVCFFSQEDLRNCSILRKNECSDVSKF